MTFTGILTTSIHISIALQAAAQDNFMQRDKKSGNVGEFERSMPQVHDSVEGMAASASSEVRALQSGSHDPVKQRT